MEREGGGGGVVVEDGGAGEEGVGGLGVVEGERGEGGGGGRFVDDFHCEGRGCELGDGWWVLGGRKDREAKGTMIWSRLQCC